MAEPLERRTAGTGDAGEDLKRAAQAGPAGVLPTVLVLLALIAIFMFGIMLLFRH
jgi:hypothetical protein